MNLTYPDAVQFLYDLQLFGTQLGLENTFKLCDAVGKPHRTLRFIHVAGTNGKGSTCAFLESIYRSAGLRTGLYTSPHLVSFRERMQVNRHWITQENVVRLAGELRDIMQGFPADRRPTFFEVVTVMALKYFAEQGCELVIWETGLGGRLDATNVVEPLASVITNIDLDHQKWLGDTLAKIAAEKAGIIKTGVPVVTAERKSEAIQVIRDVAGQVGSPLIELSSSEPLETYRTPLIGEHQHVNARLAVATVRTLSKQIAVSESDIRAGLDQVQWPGRFQIIHSGSGQTFVLDGAHNPAGARVLRDTLAKQFPSERPSFIIGAMRDKDWSAMCRLLIPRAAKVWFVPVSSARTTDPQLLRSFALQISPDVEAYASAQLKTALEEAGAERLVVVTGSLQLIGEAMELLGLSPATARSERELNEWQALV